MKTVNYPIKVPSDPYCWGSELCEHFDNEGGHPTCNLGFYIDSSKRDKIGYRKPVECLILCEIKK